MKFTPTENANELKISPIGAFASNKELRKFFKFVKSSESLPSVWTRACEVQDPVFSEYSLLPICKLHLDDPDTISYLMQLRNTYIDLFLGSELATYESTKNWLKNMVIENEDRILFLVVDKHGKRHGHLGLWLREDTNLEVDNVIKDPVSIEKGLFGAALKTITSWAWEYLGSSELSLRVLTSNVKAVEFYKSNGFSLLDTKPVENFPSETWSVMKVEADAFIGKPEKILTAGPSIGPYEIALVSDAVKIGWNNLHSDYLQTFSTSFAEYVGAKYAIPTDSCTSALHLALWALGVGPGDEVIVPEITWVSTASAVRFVGATPVFADVDELTWTIDPASVKSLITKKTKVIIPVHLYGFVADLTSLMDLCSEFGIKLLQDAAPGIGSMYKGQSVASYGDFSCFSFQGAKLLVSGEGGVITTNDERLYRTALKISDSGRKTGTFWIESLGKKMKMNNITAALALGQLHSAERQIAKKRTIRNWYAEEFSNISGARLQVETEESRSICWMTSLYFDYTNFDRESLRAHLLEAGIDTRPVFSPISQYPIWEQNWNPKSTALQIGERSINLPSGVGLSQESVRHVSRVIKDYLSQHNHI